MMSQFAEKLACIDKNKYLTAVLLFITLTLQTTLSYADAQKKSQVVSLL